MVGGLQASGWLLGSREAEKRELLEEGKNQERFGKGNFRPEGNMRLTVINFVIMRYQIRD